MISFLWKCKYEIHVKNIILAHMIAGVVNDNANKFKYGVKINVRL